MWLNAQDMNYFSEEDVRKRSAEMRAYSQPDNGGVRRGGRARAPANRHHEAAKQQQLKRKNPGTGSRLSGKQKQKTGSATNTDNTDDSEMTVKQLRVALTTLGVEPKGLKADLRQQLECEHLDPQSAIRDTPVSYTHLTLPTIYSV